MTKQQSKFLYGLAILFMLYHHLFGFPDRIDTNHFKVLDYLFVEGTEYNAAWFCKLCVGIYSFISGYGMYYIIKKNLKSSQVLLYFKELYSISFHQYYKLLKKYWIVFVLFVPLGFLLGVNSEINAIQLLANITGFSHSYNAEWWYIKQYMLMLFLLPFIHLCFDFISIPEMQTKKRCLLICLLAIVYLGSYYLLGIGKACTIIFISGYCCSRYQLFERFFAISIICKHRYIYAIIGLLACSTLRIIAGKLVGYVIIDIIIAPLFIMFICLLTQEGRMIFKLVSWVGNYSVYMWLTHSFFCYYYFKDIIVVSHISTIMYLELFGASLLISFSLNWLSKCISKKNCKK